MFKVMLACQNHCESWEHPRETLRTDDPIEAIRKSEMHRDQEHTSWVEIIEEDAPKPKYRLSISREGTGMDCEYVSIEEASDRLGAYAKSFPGEIIEANITKI